MITIRDWQDIIEIVNECGQATTFRRTDVPDLIDALSRLTPLALDPPSAADSGEETFAGYYPDGQPVVSVGGQVKLGR